jgi:type IV secretory pathway TrbD component
MGVFWFVAIALMMEAARTSETLVKFYQTTRRYKPEDSHLHVSSPDYRTKLLYKGG